MKRWLFVVPLAVACTVGDNNDAPVEADAGAMPADSSAQPDARGVTSASPWTDVRTFGAKGDGKADDTAAIQAAVDSVPQGGTVAFPPGVFLTSGVLIRADKVNLRGAGRGTVLRAKSAGDTVVHHAASDGGLQDMTLSCAGNERTVALSVSPEVERDGEVTHQNFNQYSNLQIEGCSEGVVMQAGSVGPDGAHSGCWYNVFRTIHVRFTRRGIWLRDSVSQSGSSVNRNQFYSVRVGQGVNTGLQIDSGDTNSFYGCSFEGIETGSEPNDPPTAILIGAAADGRPDNNNNVFVGIMFEANTIDVDNRNRFTEFYASSIGHKKRVGVLPAWNLGGDPSRAPLLIPGVYQSQGSLDGVMHGAWNFTLPVNLHGELAQVLRTDATDIQAGDLLRAHPDLDEHVTRTTGSADRGIVGVAFAPSLTIDGVMQVPVVHSGKARVKASTEAGPISRGDRLQAASVPGHVKKATTAGPSVGTALSALAAGSGPLTMIVRVQD